MVTSAAVDLFGIGSLASPGIEAIAFENHDDAERPSGALGSDIHICPIVVPLLLVIRIHERNLA